MKDIKYEKPRQGSFIIRLSEFLWGISVVLLFIVVARGLNIIYMAD